MHRDWYFGSDNISKDVQNLPEVKPAVRLPTSTSLDNSLGGKATPFRLPRLSSSLPEPVSDDNERVQMDLPTVRLDYNGPSATKSAPALRTLRHLTNTDVQLFGSSAAQVPRFKKASIAPQVSMPKHMNQTCLTPDVHKISLSKKCEAPDLQFTRRSRTLLRTAHSEPATSNTQVIWKLSPHPHPNYDSQALRGCIGPHSRKFIVHCSTPRTWLRMKLSRERSSVT